MGQKINPNGFRLGVNRDWEAKWYADKNYADTLNEDLRIRKFISEKLADASVSTVEIERAANRINISIHTAKPGMVIGKGGKEVEALRKQLNALTGKQVHINMLKLRNQILMLVVAMVSLVNLKLVLLSDVLCVKLQKSYACWCRVLRFKLQVV